MPIPKRPAKAAAPKPKALAKRPGRMSNSDQEDRPRQARKMAEHAQVSSPTQAFIRDLGDGQAMIACQISEIVPIAQYAGVTLGPNMLAWKLNADLNVLADVDWSQEEVNLNDEQQEVYSRVMNALKATSHIAQIHLADDREVVIDSIVERNEREASEAGSSAKKQSRARRN